MWSKKRGSGAIIDGGTISDLKLCAFLGYRYISIVIIVILPSEPYHHNTL